MVKETVAWKHKWYKNDNGNGGAMMKTIKECPIENIVIHSQTVKNGRMWTHVLPEQLLTLQKSNKGLYEVIHRYPHKLYFDIDNLKESDDLFLSNIKEQISNIFPGIEMAISGSITPEKTSYHIVAQNYMIRNDDERNTIKNVVKHLAHLNNAFDWKVYTPNRNMKCHGQSKDDGRVQSIIENDDWKAHCITCYLSENALQFAFEEEVREVIMIEKSKEPFDIASLPKLKLTMPKDINFLHLSAQNVLELLPVDKSFSHTYTHLVARFCFYNDVPFNTFLSWIQKKHADISTVKDKWSNNWKNISKFPTVDIDRMKEVLVYFYPNIKKDIHYRLFSDSFITDVPIEKIDTISQDEFKRHEKYLLFNIGMGGGKTAQTTRYLRDKKFCWIAPNKALAHNTYTRLCDEHVKVTHYLEFTTKDKRAGILAEQDSTIIVANSLHYLFKKTYPIIVIDEIETLLQKWFGSFMQNKKENWEVFLNILRNADQVILLDAFISNQTVNLIKQISGERNMPLFKNVGNNMVMFERKVEPVTRTVNYVSSTDLMIHGIISDLKRGLKLFIFYPFKHGCKDNVSMENLYNMITAETGKKGIAYNADIDDKIKLGLRDVNDTWAPMDFIITNSMITCGVNYDKIGFDTEYIFIASFSSPRDVIQVSYRPRHLTSNIINVCYAGTMTQTNTWESDVHEMKCDIYKSVIDGVLIEKKAPLRKSFQLFCIKAHYKQAVDVRKVTDAIHREVKELFENHQLLASYKNIEDINCAEEEYIVAKLFAGEATMMEKFMLQKYHFKIQYDYSEENDTFLEGVWNENHLFFFKQLIQTLANPDSVFKNIQTEWKADEMFTLPKKIKFSDKIIEQIFKEFKFKFLKKASSHKQIMKEIYNSFFGKVLIKSSYDKDRNTTYEMNEDIDANKCIVFIKNNHVKRSGWADCVSLPEEEEFLIDIS